MPQAAPYNPAKRIQKSLGEEAKKSSRSVAIPGVSDWRTTATDLLHVTAKARESWTGLLARVFFSQFRSMPKREKYQDFLRSVGFFVHRLFGCWHFTLSPHGLTQVLQAFVRVYTWSGFTVV